MIDDLIESVVVEAAGEAIEYGAKKSVVFKVLLWVALAIFVGALIYITIRYS